MLRKVQGHDYARLFAEAAAASGPTEKDCVVGLIDGVLDKMLDQITLRVTGSEQYPALDDALAFATEVRDHLHPAVERLVTKLAEDPNWLPKRAPTKGQVPASATADLMTFSLLGAPRQ